MEDSALAAAARGSKRPIERIFEKCDKCREKRIKCLPVERDFSKGERCIACEKRDDRCGPNKRTTKPSLSRSPNLDGRLSTPVTPPQPIVPSISPKIPPANVPVNQVYQATVHEVFDPRGRSSVSGCVSSAASFSSPPTLLSSLTSPCSSHPSHESIRSRFVELGYLRILFKCVQDRRRAVDDLISTNACSVSNRDVKTSLDFIAHCVKREYIAVLERILTILENLEPTQTELTLIRALQATETLTDILSRTSSLGDSCDDQIFKIHSQILNRLISIHVAAGDHPEAERLLEQLVILPRRTTVPADPDIPARLAESLSLTSNRCREVFRDLKIPKTYTDSLFFNDTGPFPPTQRAMLDQIPDVIHHLWKTPQRVLAETDILRRKIVHIAAERANLEILDLITHQKEALLKSRDIYKKTPLCVAAYYGDPSFFERLVNDGAELATRNEDGRTLLCIASGAGHLLIVNFLLDRDISPNDDILKDCSPLHAAARGGHHDICRALLDHGAWADWLSDCKTAAQVSLENCVDPRITTMLKEAEQNPWNRYPRNGHSPF